MKNIKHGTLHGELYLDPEGNAHFQCHTPWGITFEEAREGFLKFIAVLQDQVDRQAECPHYPHGKTPREHLLKELTKP